MASEKSTTRRYLCKYNCGFSRSRKKAVQRHEIDCVLAHPSQAISILNVRVTTIEKKLEDLTKMLLDLNAVLNTKPIQQELYNIHYVNDIDDLMELQDFVKEYWALAQHDKANALQIFLRCFFKHCFKLHKNFYKATENTVKVRGIIGKVGNKQYGVNGAKTQFTWYAFYDALIPGICENIEIMYGDRLYEMNIQHEDIQKAIKKDLNLARYRKPNRTNYEKDIHYRDACRNHKIYKLEIVGHLKNIML